MATIQLNVEDKLIYDIGEENIKQNFLDFLKSYSTKTLLKKISAEIKKSNIDYDSAIEQIKTESWEEYKKGLI